MAEGAARHPDAHEDAHATTGAPTQPTAAPTAAAPTAAAPTAAAPAEASSEDVGAAGAAARLAPVAEDASASGRAWKKRPSFLGLVPAGRTSRRDVLGATQGGVTNGRSPRLSAHHGSDQASKGSGASGGAAVGADVTAASALSEPLPGAPEPESESSAHPPPHGASPRASHVPSEPRVARGQTGRGEAQAPSLQGARAASSGVGQGDPTGDTATAARAVGAVEPAAAAAASSPSRRSSPGAHEGASGAHEGASGAHESASEGSSGALPEDAAGHANGKGGARPKVRTELVAHAAQASAGFVDGFVTKRGKGFPHKWQRRYFFLDGGTRTLHYYETDGKPNGSA